jgi:hypothetical protein
VFSADRSERVKKKKKKKMVVDDEDDEDDGQNVVPGDREGQTHSSRGPQSAQTLEQNGRLFRCSR